ncbi:MICOS complex subunit mic60 [Knufia fluminis]|uniref:MICOS complex subunit MIC60 n=1 Tax=Knufia fluminis TaxID=191047 RepID=A0AAN8ED68_9EURO|nr:MICOS complex subunit mic60 [Knufia fluminis]
MLRLARPLSVAARRQLVYRPLATQIRGYAERSDSMLSSDPSFRPDVPQQGVVPPAIPVLPSQPTPATPSSTTTIPPANIPKEPPPPTTTLTTPPTSGSSASPPPPPPPSSSPPPKPTRFRRLRVLFYLTLLSALGYGGAVFYALRSDNFHDFFTEYVPFGEDSVLYFEEKAFHKKFPNARSHAYRAQQRDLPEDKKVKIPLGSGLSSRTIDESKDTDVSTKGKHMSAIEDNKATKDETKQQPDNASTKARSAAVESVKKDAPATKAAPKEVSTPQSKKESKPAPAPAPPSSAAPSPKSDPRPPAIAPVTAISPVTVPNGDEPVVQELVKIVNDLITVVNSDHADVASKYSAPLQKAKDATVAAASHVSALREAERAAAEERIKEAHKEFDEGAKKLLERIETAQREDDVRYREEFEAERAKIAQQYENRLKAEVERSQQVWEQKMRNELSEQGLKMKQKFIEDIQGLVEAERDGRLSKITDLSGNVDKLTQLTTNWNGVIDANLATQKLQVAVDAVRSALDDANATHKPTPFVREMAALKLVADSDSVIDAAVASINPAAYQKGIPSSAQLIDRFRRVANEVRKASLLPENAGIASHAASFMLSKVMFKKQGVPEGNDVESVLTRTETLLEEGDLDNAAREMNELKGWAGVLSKDWLNDARKVLEVKQALDVIETEARLQCLRVE